MSFFKYLSLSYTTARRHFRQYTSLTVGLGLFVVALTLSLSWLAGPQATVSQTGTTLIHVQGGSVIADQSSGQPQYQLAQTVGTPAIFTHQDLENLDQLTSKQAVAPLIFLNLKVSTLSGEQASASRLVVTNQHFPAMANLEIDTGKNTLGGNRPSVVIGDKVAQELFQHNQPLSYEILIGQKPFLIGGILKPSEQPFDPLGLADDWGHTIFIPYEAFAQDRLAEEQPFLIYKIFIQAEGDTTALTNEIRQKLAPNHPDENFSILVQESVGIHQAIYRHLFTTILSLCIIVVTFILNVLIWHHLQTLKITLASRRPEIMVSHIVGAQRKQIIVPILLEAPLLCLLLAGLFSGLSLVLIWLLQTSFSLSFAPYWQIFLYNGVVGLLVGLLVGGYAAYLLRQLDFLKLQSGFPD